jgi:hypothetical protein
VLLAGGRGYHRDDWESSQVRIGADGRVGLRVLPRLQLRAGMLNQLGAGIGILAAAAEPSARCPLRGRCELPNG